MSELDKQFEKEILNVVKDEDLAKSISYGWKSLSYEEKNEIIKHLMEHKEDLKPVFDYLKKQGMFEKTTEYTIYSMLTISPFLSLLSYVMTGNPSITFASLFLPPVLANAVMNLIKPEFKKFIDNVKSHIGFKKYIKKLEQKIPKLISTLEERAKGLLHKVV